MKLAELRARRLHALSIADPPPHDAPTAVARLLALQAQDHAGMLWAIGLRTPGARRSDVERAFAGRSIVRTWPLRGTLHCVAAADVHWLLDLLAPRVLARSQKRHRDLALDAKLLRAVERVLLRALQGGQSLTRDELREHLGRAKLQLEGPRLYHCLWYWAQHKLLCFGAPRGKQPTFTLLDTWLGAAPRPLPRDVALAQLAGRYFTGHGPASLPDLARWAGISLTEARQGLADVRSQLAEHSVDGVPHYAAAAASPPTAASRGAFLLPGFDEYMLGYKDRAAILDPRHASAIVPGGNGVFRPTLVLRGQVVGTWRAAEIRTEVRVELRPFTPLTAAARRLAQQAAQRYAAYLGKSARVV